MSRISWPNEASSCHTKPFASGAGSSAPTTPTCRRRVVGAGRRQAGVGHPPVKPARIGRTRDRGDVIPQLSIAATWTCLVRINADVTVRASPSVRASSGSAARAGPGGRQDCDEDRGCSSAPIGSRPIRSASRHTIRPARVRPPPVGLLTVRLTLRKASLVSAGSTHRYCLIDVDLTGRTRHHRYETVRQWSYGTVRPRRRRQLNADGTPSTIRLGIGEPGRYGLQRSVLRTEWALAGVAPAQSTPPDRAPDNATRVCASCRAPCK